MLVLRLVELSLDYFNQPMTFAVSGLFFVPYPSLIGVLPGLDTLMSTQGIMVGLLAAYAGAMWMFLTSAPKVHTVMVSDLELARRLYEGMLELPAADVYQASVLEFA